LNVSAATTLSSTLGVTGATTIAGITSLTSTLNSTSTTNGALTVSGGVGIVGALNVGGATALSSTLGVSGATTLSSTLSVSGVTTLSNTSPSSATNNGALTVSGGVGIGGALNVGTTLNVGGISNQTNRLFVSGSSTNTDSNSLFRMINTNNNTDFRINPGMIGGTPVANAVTYELPGNGFHFFWDYFYSVSTAGVWLISCRDVNNPVTHASGSFPLLSSCANVTNLYNTGTGSLTRQDTSLNAGGSFYTVNFDNSDNFYLIMPGYGIVAFQNSNYTGTILLNVRNNTSNAICCSPSSIDTLSSYRVFYNNTQL